MDIKKLIIALVVIAAIAAGAYYFMHKRAPQEIEFSTESMPS